MAANKYLIRQGAIFAERAGIIESAGAADAGKLVALTSDGRIEPTVCSRDSVNESLGSADEGKIPVLGGDGKLDVSVTPSVAGDTTKVMLAAEILSAGQLVNMFMDSGTLKARKADATAGLPAHGFVKESVVADTVLNVYIEGLDVVDMGSGATGLPAFLGDAGAVTTTPPSTAGVLSQKVGISLGAAGFVFVPDVAVLLA
jgi:hypothetical protein